MFLNAMLKYIVVSFLISLIFGATVSTSLIIKKVFKKDRVSNYLFQFWSLVAFVVIWIYFKPGIQIFNVQNLLSWESILLFIIAVIPTSIVAYQAYKLKPNYRFKFIYFIDGASMEIPMRLLVQNLFVILGLDTFLLYSLSLEILLNAIIWVQFIIVQEVIEGRKITRGILPEIISSFWFSIWVGILFKITGNIVIPMIAHGLQRFTTYKISQRFGKTLPSNTSIQQG